MKRGYVLLLCVFSFFTFLKGEAPEDLFVHIPPKISLKVEELGAFEGKPIPLDITVLHLNEDVVDPSSFLLDDKPLSVKLISTVAVGPSSLFKGNEPNTLYVSRYKTLLDPRPAGVYTLGPLMVTLSGVVYQSGSVVFNVEEAVISKKFTLSSRIDAPSSLYPGQKIGVTYFISFQDRVQILNEKLPLIELEGFSPLGAAVSTIASSEDDQFVETIHREFRSTRSGTFVFDPSVIEGMKYVVQGTEHVVIPPLMRAKEAGKELTVLPFPDTDKPSFFNGAIGSFTWRGRIIGSNKVEVEGFIEVEWRVTGRGDMDTVTLPSLNSDPLFSSRFLIEGEPKETREDEATKSFRVFLRPKAKDVKEVPSFWFASFDPSSKNYITSLTQPLPLEVVERAKEGPEESKRKNTSFVSLPFDPLLVKNISEESPLTLGMVWCVSFSLLVVGFVEQQLVEKRLLIKKMRKSRDLFFEAFAKRTKKKEGLTLLEEALLLRMFEIGLIQHKEQSVGSLSDDGLVGEVKRTIQDIDMHLYGRQGDMQPVQKIWEDAALLFQAMKSMKERE